MCTVDSVVKGVAIVARTVVPAVKTYQEQKDNLKYRTNLALNNMKEAKNNALAQKQAGIEEARKQKISGLRLANEMFNQNASYGFEADSGNNLYNYDDTIENYYNTAFDTQHTYDVRADNYFESANEYLKSAKSYQQQSKKVGWKVTKNALGNTTSVASKWFS